MDEVMTGGSVEDSHVNLSLKSTYECTWELRNFTSRYRFVKEVISPPVGVGGFKFCLLLVMQDENHHQDSSSKNFQEYDVPNPYEDNFTIDICFLKNNEEFKENIVISKKYSPKKGVLISLTTRKSFLLNEKNNILTDNTLKVLCKIIVNPCLVAKKQKNRLIELSPIHELDCDFNQFLNNEQFSDVKFIVGEQTLFAHKIILSQKSRYFSAMFASGMLESTQNVIKIEDMEYEVFKELLKYMYTGKSIKVKDIAEELLIAADRYEVSGLAHMCTENLCHNLSGHNALHLLELSERMNNKKIKEKALEYINDKPELKKMQPAHQDIIDEVFEAVKTAKKRKSSSSEYVSDSD